MYIPPTVLLLIAITLSYGVSILLPAMQFTDVSVSLLGVFLIALGTGLFLWAGKLLRHYKTTLHPQGKPSKLVTRGPYALTRNPMYLGFFLISLGTALLFANVLAFVGPLIFFAFASTFIIPFEEHILNSRFGKSYKSYTAKIRRWI